MRGTELVALLEQAFVAIDHPEVARVRRTEQGGGEQGIRVECSDGSACFLIDWGHPGSSSSEKERPSHARG